MTVAVRVLGPLEVTSQGRSVVIRGAQERRLLVRLALEAARVVSTNHLVEAIWGDDAPASAEASLRVLVSRVRKALSAAGSPDALETRPPGYLLAADEVDVTGFGELAIAGRKELLAGRPFVAAARLADALALWHGDRLAEGSSDYLHVEADRLDQLRLGVLEDRIEADLACGRHRDVLDELAVLCPSHPLREGLWAHWMTALYRCHRQGDALKTYQQLRRTLASELGLDPSPALQQLEAAVLGHEPSLAAPTTTIPTQRPRLLVPIDTVGPELAGREAELKVLWALWEAARAGTSKTALVSGDAGIGKTRLLRELAHHALEHGGTVAYGRCDSDLSIPYQPFRESLAEVLAQFPQALDGVGTAELAELRRFLPGMADPGPGAPALAKVDPDLERYLLFGTLASLVGACSSASPLVLILDDLHWADRPTLQLLQHLTGMNLGRVMLVGAHRDSERIDGPLVETLGELHRHSTVTRIPLKGLTRDEAVRLLTSTAGLEPDASAQQLVRLLHDETAGNPFYLTEMLRHLLDTQAIAALPDGRCTASLGIENVGLPDSIREVIRARLARLGAETTSVLSCAAVIGEEFDLEVLAGATGVAEERLLDRMEEAGRTALIHEVADKVGRFRFAHAIVQHTLYLDTSPSRRSRAHARIASSIEVLGRGEPGVLAHHYLAGITPGTTKTAIQHARAAAEHAMFVAAPTEAARWYAAALNALPPPHDDVDHGRTLLDLGVAQRHAGQPSYRRTLLDAVRIAQLHNADDLLAEAALALSPGGFSVLGRVDADVVEALEAALDVVAPGTAQQAGLLATLAGELTWHPDFHRRIALVEQAVRVARHSGDKAALFEAIVRPAAATWVPETSERRVSLFREAVALAEEAHDRLARFSAVMLLAPALVERGDADRLDEALAEAAEMASEIREPSLRSMALFIRSCMAIVNGNLALAEQQGEEALRLSIDGGPSDGQDGHDEVLGIIRWHQGRLFEMLPQLRTTHLRLPGVPTRRAGLALAEALSGDAIRAKAMLREAADRNFDLFYGAPWLGCMCLWSAVAVEVGDVGAAAALYPKLLPWKELFGTGGPMPVHGVSHALARLAALLGDVESADRHFADAWRIHRHMRAPFYVAETGLHWGIFLQKRDPARSAELITEAGRLARRYGFGEVERRALGTGSQPHTR